MAIYSLHHGTVGRATQAQPGTAGAHLRYITREGAARVVMVEHMPEDRNAARSWMDRQEAADRKNARIIDKLMVALPVELDTVERVQLVREFVADVTRGRTPWMAAIHDRDEDAHNPHAHIVIRDRDIESGKRAIGLSEKGSTERLREAWEVAANRALERAGVEARIDRRSLEAQGIAREAGIHVGANVYKMEEHGVRPDSVAQELEDGRVVNWPEIDQGRTRADRQREIEADNASGRAKESSRSKNGEIAASLTPTATMPEPGLSTESPEHSGSAEPAAPTADQHPATAQPSSQPEAPLAKSRLILAIERGWEKLANLAGRLESAWRRVTQETKPPPLRPPPPPSSPPSVARLRLEPEPFRLKVKADAPRPTPPRPEVEAHPEPNVTESSEERRKRRYAELLAEQIAKRPPSQPSGSGPKFGR